MGFQSPAEEASADNAVDSNNNNSILVRKVREFYLLPSEIAMAEEEYLSVDDERFEVMPMHVSLLKKRINFFAP